MTERQWASLTDGDLVGMAQSGDLKAFEALFQRYQARIYGIVYGMVSNPTDAADLAQEAFVRAFKQLAKLRADGAVYAWLRTTAVHLGIDFLRRRASLTFESLDAGPRGGENATREIEDWQYNPHRQLTAQMRQQAVNDAIGALSDDHRAVVVMHHLEGMGVDEIADALSVPAGTVKSRLARAREAMRRKLSAFAEA